MRIDAIKHAVLRALPAVEAEQPLPTEFVIFTPGINESFNGPCLYDAEAEALVMAEYKRHGVRLMVDLEHYSLDPFSDRPDSKDARAWFDLEPREGSLYAVNVEWTEDGERRLRSRTQRYTSSAFLQDKSVDPPRVRCLLNVALVSMPATYGTAPLVRAFAVPRLHDPKHAIITRSMLTPELAAAAAAAIQEKNGDAALQLLTDILVAAASGETAPEPSGEAPEGEPAASAVEEAPATEPEEDPNKPAARSVDAGDPDHLERAVLVARLVACKAETPHTAWSVRGKTPVARLVSEPIAELRSRVAALESANKPAIKPPAAPPSEDPIAEGVKKLSKQELADCKKAGIEPKDYVERKLAIKSRFQGAK